MKQTKQPTRSKLAPSNEGAGHDTSRVKKRKAADDGFELVIQMPTGAFDKLAAQMAALDKRNRRQS